MIVLGLHETCVVVRIRKPTAIAEAAEVMICLHGVFEAGITALASDQVAATLNSMDDGNPIMWKLFRKKASSRAQA